MRSWLGGIVTWDFPKLHVFIYSILSLIFILAPWLGSRAFPSNVLSIMMGDTCSHCHGGLMAGSGPHTLLKTKMVGLVVYLWGRCDVQLLDLSKEM